MKSIRVIFIGALIIAAMLILIPAIYYVYNFSKLLAEELPGFAHMQYPMLVLSIAFIFSLILGLYFAFKALIMYKKGQIFESEMVASLENIGLSFFACSLITILIIIYTIFNVDGSITNLFFTAAAVALLLISQIMLLIADVVNKGVDFKEDSELTI